MLCQACEKNETKVAVICDSCVAHYASIREGQYMESEIVLGEQRFAVRSWLTSPGSSYKHAARDHHLTKKKGKFGRQAAPEPVSEVELLPPPDWKNRVFPLPDPEPDSPAPAAAESAAETMAPAEAFDSPDALEFFYELPTPTWKDEPSEPEAHPAEAIEIAPAYEPEPPAPAPELASFFESLDQPEPTMAIEPAAEDIPGAALSNFFDSLGLPAAADAIPVPVPPAPAAELTGFFESLGIQTPQEPETAPAEQEKPTEVILTGFFDSLGSEQPAPVEEAAADVAPQPLQLFEFLTPSSEPEDSAPASEAAAAEESSAESSDPSTAALADFFESLNDMPLTSPSDQATPMEELPFTHSDLASFFESLNDMAQPTSEVSGANETRRANTDAPAGKPFTIELQPSSQAAAAAEPPMPRVTGVSKQTGNGKPFTIELGSPLAPKPSGELVEPKPSPAIDLHFTRDEEDDRSGSQSGGLVFDIKPLPRPDRPATPSDDDEDEGKTIDL